MWCEGGKRSKYLIKTNFCKVTSVGGVFEIVDLVDFLFWKLWIQNLISSIGKRCQCQLKPQMEVLELWNWGKTSMVLYILITSQPPGQHTKNFESDIFLRIFVSKCRTFPQPDKYSPGHKDQIFLRIFVSKCRTFPQPDKYSPAGHKDHGSCVDFRELWRWWSGGY